CDEELDPGEHTIEVRDHPELGRAVTVARAERTDVQIAVPETARAHGWGGFGVLLTIGSVLAAGAGASIAGFGVYANDLHARFDATPTVELADEGELMRDLANASIGVAIGGASLVLLDVILF